MADKTGLQVYFRGLDSDPSILPPPQDPLTEERTGKAYVHLQALLRPGEVLGVEWKTDKFVGHRRALMGDLDDFREILDLMRSEKGTVTSFFGATTRRLE
jgi:hypothetical protein